MFVFQSKTILHIIIFFCLRCEEIIRLPWSLTLICLFFTNSNWDNWYCAQLKWFKQFSQTLISDKSRKVEIGTKNILKYRKTCRTFFVNIHYGLLSLSSLIEPLQLTFAYSKSTIETLETYEKDVKYVQS